MKKSHVLLLLLVQVIVLLPLLCLSDDFVSSRATYYGSPDCKGNPLSQRVPRPKGLICVAAVRSEIRSGRESNLCGGTHSCEPFNTNCGGGACGYGEFGRDINDGEVSGVSSRLWKNGAGCGACYQEDCKEWKRMRRVFGAVHDYQNPPRGTLSLRFLVYGSAGLNWVESQNALPPDWTAGATYNSNILLT